jgi:hypothetical protein
MVRVYARAQFVPTENSVQPYGECHTSKRVEDSNSVRPFW